MAGGQSQAEKEAAKRETAYLKSLKVDADREARRAFMAEVEDYLADRDTPGAANIRSMVDDVVARIAREKAESALAGDPLRLRPEHRKVKAAEEKAKKKAEEAEKRKRKKARKESDEAALIGPDDLQERQVRDPMYGVQTVKIRGYALRGIENDERRAVERFIRDYEIAYQATMKGMPWTPKVDGGGGSSRRHIATIDAQDRLARLKGYLGDRDYRILEAVAIYDIGPSKLKRAGGHQASSVGDEIRRVVGLVMAFYQGAQPKKDRLIETIDALIDGELRRIVESSSGVSGEEARRRAQTKEMQNVR